MISLLHNKDYEMLGNLEIRRADWEKLRQLGPVRFVMKCCVSSYSGRIGAILIISSIAGVHGLHLIERSAWFLIAYGTFGVLMNIQYAIRSWFRLDRRFHHSAQA